MRKKILLGIILSLLIIFFVFIINYYKKTTRNIIESFAVNRQMINVLIAGSNVFNGNRHSFYAVLSINPDNRRIGLTFIPPEFRVRMDSGKKEFLRIKDVDISNFKSLSESLESSLKLNIPFYVILYSPDVERIVDLIEGINLYVLDDLKVPGIEFGLNYFDGKKINQYINSVEGNSVYKKYDRIQDILLTLYSNKEKYKSYYNLEFISEILKTIKTNLLAQEILSLITLLSDNQSDLICTVMPGFFSEDKFYVTDDIAYKIYKNDFLKKLVTNSDYEQQVKIKILNGTDIDGLAKKVRRKFVGEGFNVVEFGTSPYPMFKESVLINRKGSAGQVKKVGEFINVNNIYHSVDSTQLNDVLLIIGTDMAGR